MICQEARTPIYYVRRGTLYGAAIGMLAGLAAVTIQDDVGREAIVVWRNWIVAFALVGLAAGSFRAVQLKLGRRNIESHSDQPA